MKIVTTNPRMCSQISDLINNNPLFTCLNETQMQRVCQHARVVNLAEGDVLFNHGDRVHLFYFVIDGLIKLYRQSTQGQEKIFELEGPGTTLPRR